MNTSIGQMIVGLLLSLLIGAMAWSTSQGLWARMSWRGFLMPALPSIVMIASFYALAGHMYVSLGGWPTSIGEAGFPRALLWHSQSFVGYFTIVSLVSLFVWPIALIACALVKSGRQYIGSLAVYGVAFVVCFVAMQIGPKGFLYWWRD